MSTEKFLKDLRKKLINEGTLLPIETKDCRLDITKLNNGGLQFLIENNICSGISAKMYINLTTEEVKKILEFTLFRENKN